MEYFSIFETIEPMWDVEHFAQWNIRIRTDPEVLLTKKIENRRITILWTRPITTTQWILAMSLVVVALCYQC